MPKLTAYHVSPIPDIAAFRAGTHFGSLEASLERSAASKFQSLDLYLYRVDSSLTSPLEIYDEGGVHCIEYLVSAVRAAKPKALSRVREPERSLEVDTPGLEWPGVSKVTQDSWRFRH